MTARPRPDWLSPSLIALPEGAVPAYELKFLVPEPTARQVEDWAAAHLATDPHADPAGHGYRVTTLYLDTPRLDVCRRTPGYADHKHRVRRYGAEPTAHLERKSKRGGRVWKHRTALPLADLAGALPAGWFAQEAAALGLRPACRVTYDRAAFVGSGPTGPIRLTIDRAASGAAADGLGLEPVERGVSLLDGAAVVEFKFLLAVPPAFKQVVAAFGLTPAGVSKYRRYAAAAGLLAEGPADA